MDIKYPLISDIAHLMFLEVCLREEGGTIFEILLVTTYPGAEEEKEQQTNITNKQTKISENNHIPRCGGGKTTKMHKYNKQTEKDFRRKQVFAKLPFFSKLPMEILLANHIPRWEG